MCGCVCAIQVGSLSHGDLFLQVLVGFLTAPRARGISKLDISDCGMGDNGAVSIAALLISSTTLQELHLTRNYLSPRGRSLLYRALVVRPAFCE